MVSDEAMAEFVAEKERIFATPGGKLLLRVNAASSELILAWRENGFGDPPAEMVRALEAWLEPSKGTTDQLNALTEKVLA